MWPEWAGGITNRPKFWVGQSVYDSNHLLHGNPLTMNGGKKVFLNVRPFYVLFLDPDMILLGKFNLREKGSQRGKYARETIESVGLR